VVRPVFALSAFLPVAVLLSACVTTPQEEPEGDWCSGLPILVVRNDSGTSIEIVETRRGNLNVIATVGPGRHELEIRREAAYSYLARSLTGEVLVTMNRPRARDRTVLLERRCETANPGARTGGR
jgi:hypothetical protein